MVESKAGRVARRCGTAAVVAAVMSGAVMVGAISPAAAADASGCTDSEPDNSRNCIVVESWGGSGTRITRIAVGRVTDRMCNFHFEAVVRTSDGVEIDRHVGPTSYSCVSGTAWQEWAPDKVYPDGARICGYAFDGSNLTPGYPCQTVLDKSPDPVECRGTQMEAYDPLICPYFASLSGCHGVVRFDSEGDMYILGEQFWDCPPYEGDIVGG